MTTKNNLKKSMSLFYSQFWGQPEKLHEVLPTTFVIKVGVDDSDYTEFVRHFKRIKNKKFDSNLPRGMNLKNIWIIKPENFNQGRGIQIFKDMNEIMDFINRKPPGSCWVI